MKNNRFSSLVWLLIMISLLILVISGCGGKNDTAIELEKFMEAYNENSSYKYSGTILVAKGDEILLNEGYGIANYEKNIPNRPDNVFAIGSITKSFTAVAIMQLQEKGFLNVNDPISKYIDGLDRGDDITIHHLLTHTSGLDREGRFLGRQEVLLEENINLINKRMMLFEPGEDYSYSNAGYIVLAAIIEKVSGESYNDYIHANIFTHLSMDNTRGGIDDTYAENQSIGYNIMSNDARPQSIYNFSCIIGSGNIYSTVEDLYKYDRGLKYDKLLKKESIEKASSPHWGDLSNGYGYGWIISEKYDRKRLSHGGAIGGGGYNSFIIRYPDDDYVLIFLSNNSDVTALMVVSETMEAIVFGEEYIFPQKIETAELDSGILQQYAGDYKFEEGFTISVFYKNDKLYATADDGNLYQLLPVNETCFYYEGHPCTKVEFELADEENVVALKVWSSTRYYEGNKTHEF
ncbi:serine hydrolase [Alkaliphilus peptidifermentans]|uniref:CubicO group peptidase, beta-lactamase class C family n=1 Tax=Alkaliphilus peptidifermentans DSM 18978 TaxID=1120976 RepID=A0A1G5J1V2_9FIRM|nr:serine hydrolase [Alkaliphilus peptidifermentans]SCY81931.1 CubicO group peptidase, beta-lactamase class C family [Alkaliphilus peptidifermentans DSM 18978]